MEILCEKELNLKKKFFVKYKLVFLRKLIEKDTSLKIKNNEQIRKKV